MRLKRIMRTVLTTGVALATASVIAVAAPAAAQASPHSKMSQTSRVLIAPPAPSSADLASALPATVASPTISPAVTTKHIAPLGVYDCHSGYFCTAVWDPTTSNWKIFFLYSCTTYSVNHWVGNGSYRDNQTGGVASYFYNQQQNAVKRITPDGGENRLYDWDPIWYIKNC